MSEIARKFYEWIDSKKPDDHSAQTSAEGTIQSADQQENWKASQKHHDLGDNSITNIVLSSQEKALLAEGDYQRFEIIGLDQERSQQTETNKSNAQNLVRLRDLAGLVAQAPDVSDTRIFKPDLPVAALRELNRDFPELHSTKNRLVLGEGNIFDHMREADKWFDKPIIDKFKWFREKENTNANWDYKSFYSEPIKHKELRQLHLHKTETPEWVQDYGNFHYGAVAFALGLSKEEALLYAGAAQQGGTEKHDLKTPAGIFFAIKNTVKAATMPNNGDSDFNDQFRINQGWEWAKKNAPEIGIRRQ